MSIARNLQAVRERIAEAASKSGRHPDSVRLVGITSTFKGVSPEAVIEAVQAGLEDLGENRVQEAAAKIPLVAQSTAAPIHWHLVGHLQTNKVKPAAALFDTIHSVDSVRIAEQLARAATRPMGIYLEVQFAETPGRFGFTPGSVGDAFDTIASLPCLTMAGLMTVAPLGLNPEETRRVFRSLREIRDAIEARHPGSAPLGLSMGMTDDYVAAIEEGATVVRIGRAVFGAQA